MNSKLLLSVMTLHGDTIRSLAGYLGKTEQIVSKKINENGTEFKQKEIGAIKHRYNLSSDQIDLIFFSEEVSDLDTIEQRKCDRR